MIRGTLDINVRHAQMARSDATKELRAHEPNVHIESEVSALCHAPFPRLTEFDEIRLLRSKLFVF